MSDLRKLSDLAGAFLRQPGLTSRVLGQIPYFMRGLGYATTYRDAGGAAGAVPPASR